MVEIFILQPGKEGEGIVRSDWLDDRKQKRVNLPQ